MRLVVEIFDGTGNFDMWQSELLDALFQKGLGIAIDEKKPDDMKEKDWKTLNQLTYGSSDDINIGDNFEVTDNDMNDSKIVAALKSLSWPKDSNPSDDIMPQSTPTNKEIYMEQVKCPLEAI
ncbi:hypothetical protein J1N35_005723 [Gossypium stocksii]|uniref:Uncharacterized protein n=1 Tax=Gossypium stocksii TaxID=47602 RepID=A0A9D3WF03_9ROSI|nr:hypothetical protein J1N35_005723 [Gossypium stocksii]